jgi:hypothetical protein
MKSQDFHFEGVPRAESAGPGPSRSPFTGAGASRFRAGERYQNQRPETSRLPLPSRSSVSRFASKSVEGHGVRGDQHFSGMDRGKRRGGRLGSEGMPFYA